MTPSAGHLILVGLMGAGKTVVGETCARRLGRVFVDTDALVATEAGASVAEVFAAEGEASFRDRERRALSGACSSPQPAVIACGGGAVLDAENRRAMKESGVVVWLTAPPEVLAERVGATGGGDSRPLLAGGAPVVVLAHLAETRRPAYEAAADAVVDTTGLAVDEVATAVLAAFGPPPTPFSRKKSGSEPVELRENAGGGT